MVDDDLHLKKMVVYIFFPRKMVIMMWKKEFFPRILIKMKVIFNL